MSKSSTFENDLLKLIFLGVGIANIADNAASSPLGNLYFSLHTADPGNAGTQSTSETTYAGYQRVAVQRGAGGFTVTGSSVSPVALVAFPECSAGTATITHFGIGTASSGAGKLLYSGTVTSNISVAVGVTPRLKTDTSVTED